MKQREKSYMQKTIGVLLFLLSPALFAGEQGTAAWVSSKDGNNKVVLRAIAPMADSPLIWVTEDGQHHFLGIEVVSLTSRLLSFFGVSEDSGVMVGGVEPDGPGARAGIQVGDILTAIDGEPLESAAQISIYLRTKEDGDLVEIDSWRERQKLSISATLEKREIPGLELAEIAGNRLTWVSRMAKDQTVAFFNKDDMPARLEVIEIPDMDLQQRVKELEARLKQLEKLIEVREN